MAAVDVLRLVALVIALAVAAEMLGDRVGLPNFLFYILAGLVAGPAGLGIVHHESFGTGLAVLVGLGVAIVIFHSGSGVTREAFRAAPRALLLLATVGVGVTFLGTAAATYLLMDVPWGIALLVGALLVATGSTVIEPLLESVPVRDELAATLEIEATVTEVTAGVLSITVFNAFTLSEPDSTEFVLLFGKTLVAGAAVGLAVGAVVWVLFTKVEKAPKRAPEHASQLYIATAVVTFALAEGITKEAGVPAVAVAGILLGNADLPYEERVGTFEADFAAFIIAFIFVVFASFADPGWLTTVGLAGLAVAVVVILVVRPLAVALSTMGSVLTTREKVFLGVSSPRGIIPAGVATLLALGIQDSNPTAAVTITGTVLLVIILSAAVEGLVAGRVAERFGLTTETAVVVGAGRVGLSLAERYAQKDEQVVLVESDPDVVERARSAGFTVYTGDGTEDAVLAEAGTDRATRVVAATGDPETNREVALVARSAFDVETIIARVPDEADRELFDGLDVELAEGSQLDLWALNQRTDERTPDWLVALERTGGVASVPVPPGADTTVGDLDGRLPDRAFVLAVTRDDRTWIPSATEPVESGDDLTVVGRSGEVGSATHHLFDGDGDPATGGHGERGGGDAAERGGGDAAERGGGDAAERGGGDAAERGGG